MMIVPRMADSVEPWKIPALYAQKPNGVAAYFDGHYAWTPAELARFPRHIMISVTGNPSAMKWARALDVERGDASPSMVPGCMTAREAFGHRDFEVYCSRDTIPAILGALDEHPQLGEPWWWIATLDSQPWTPDELARDISQREGVTIDARRIHAIQNMGLGDYDSSRCFGQTWTSAS